MTTTAGNVGPVTVNAGSTQLINFPAGTTVTGIISQAGLPHGVVSPGPVIPPPAWTAGVGAAGWVSNVTLGPPPGCCYDIYFDSSPGEGGCYIWLLPSAGPPPCGP